MGRAEWCLTQSEAVARVGGWMHTIEHQVVLWWAHWVHSGTSRACGEGGLGFTEMCEVVVRRRAVFSWNIKYCRRITVDLL